VAGLPPRGKTRELVAGWAKVSPRTAQDAITVYASDPDLFEQVKQGQLSVDQAARRVRQAQRDAALAATPPLPDGLFDLVYADPPWRLPSRPDSSRAVENHYPTMPLEQIKALHVPAAADSVLYLWAVNSLLPEALEVVEAWGFRYATNYAWVKDKVGLGHWNRTQHELLLVGVRGSPSPPAERARASSVIEAPRRRHSQKPDQVVELLERLHPHARKLELFARGKSRPGWITWGNEADNA
jgi:N6-adenosine-specific RNA methylase IME4